MGQERLNGLAILSIEKANHASPLLCLKGVVRLTVLCLWLCSVSLSVLMFLTSLRIQNKFIVDHSRIILAALSNTLTVICLRKVIRQGLLCLRTLRAGCIVYSYAPGAHILFLTQHRYTQLKQLANEQNTPFSTTNKRYITATSRRGSGLGAP